VCRFGEAEKELAVKWTVLILNQTVEDELTELNDRKSLVGGERLRELNNALTWLETSGLSAEAQPQVMRSDVLMWPD
jgi:hypothetical protein